MTNVGDEENEPPSHRDFEIVYQEEEYSPAVILKDEGEYDPDFDFILSPDETISGWIGYEISESANQGDVEVQYTQSTADSTISWN